MQRNGIYLAICMNFRLGQGRDFLCHVARQQKLITAQMVELQVLCNMATNADDPYATHTTGRSICTDILCRRRQLGRLFLQTGYICWHFHVLPNCSGRVGYGEHSRPETGAIWYTHRGSDTVGVPMCVVLGRRINSENGPCRIVL